MIRILDETASDVAAREALLDRAFGPGRQLKTSERLRQGRLPAAGLSLAAHHEPGANGSGLVGTVRLWHVAAGRDCPALLLGPLAVEPGRQGDGIGAQLMAAALARAAAAGHRAVLLVGDAPYYGRFGFSAEKTGSLWLPGPFQRERLLGRELVAGGLSPAQGLVTATGALRPVEELATPCLAGVVAATAGAGVRRLPRAA